MGEMDALETYHPANQLQTRPYFGPPVTDAQWYTDVTLANGRFCRGVFIPEADDGMAEASSARPAPMKK
jgi:hypothetical protein